MIAASLAAAPVGGTPAAAHGRPEHSGGPPVGGVSGVEVPSIEWRDAGDGYERGTVRVPYDYQRLDGRTFRLALMRLPATDPDERLGSLFINFGGPGATATDTVRAVGRQLFSPEVLARYDLVGVDPRGVGGSRQVRCLGGTQAQDRMPYAMGRTFPTNRAERIEAFAQARRYALRCQARNGDLLDHVGTLQFARDLDVVRAALGDENINLVGLSYGTFLAQVVANVFPDRTGALLLDAVVDPAWASGPAGTISWAREHADQASWSTLRRFFRLCDQAGRERCSFAAGRPRSKYAALAARLRHDPIHVRVPGQGRQVLGYPDLVGGTLSGLYNSFKWPLLADLLQAAYVGDRRTLGRLLDQLGEPSTPTYDNYRDVGLAITCGDTDNPGRFGRYAEVARTRDARVAPYFGSSWAYHPMVCAAWTGRSTERYTGPWTPRTTQPVLLITSRHDPATPYRNARKVARLIPNSALITVDGVGHGGLFASSCAARLATRYLLTRATPEPGTRCQPDITPFGAAAPSHRPVAIPQALQ